MPDKPYQLVVVMPVYNEAEAIALVLSKWCAMLNALGLSYRIRVYNDGSKDATGQILQREAAASDGRILAIDKPNSGHGPTILQGYSEAVEEADWIFQVDSDDEMPPESFLELWSRREHFDFLVGRRAGRCQPFARKVISFVSRSCVRLFYGQGVWDVNTPYRLMRAEVFASLYAAIPSDTFAPNVLLSGLVARRGLRTFEMFVPQHNRTTGEVSIKKWRLLKAAVRSFVQTIAFAVKYGTLKSWFWGAMIFSCIAKVALVMGDAWPTYDTTSFRLVAESVLGGGVPWVFGRYNYGPIWAGVVAMLKAVAGDGWFFEVLVVLLLALGESAIALLLWRKGRPFGAFLFILSPLGIYCTGCLRMFDSLAILLALIAVFWFGEERKQDDWWRIIWLSFLMGVSIMLKQVCFFFPFWLAFRERRWSKRMAVLLLPMIVFVLGFLPFVAKEGIDFVRERGFRESVSLVYEAQVEGADTRNVLRETLPVTSAIYRFVFCYRPYNYPIFWDDFAPRALQRLYSPFHLFVVAVLGFGWLLRKQDSIHALGFYCAALVLFSCGHWTYYWSIPILFTALYPNRWSLLFNGYGVFYCWEYSDHFKNEESLFADLFMLLLIFSVATALNLKNCFSWRLSGLGKSKSELSK